MEKQLELEGIPQAPSKEEEREVDLIIAYQQVFNSGSGQLVLDDLIRRSNLLSAPMPQTKDDIYKNIYSDGKKAIVLAILSLLDSKIDTVRKAYQQEEY